MTVKAGVRSCSFACAFLLFCSFLRSRNVPLQRIDLLLRLGQFVLQIVALIDQRLRQCGELRILPYAGTAGAKQHQNSGTQDQNTGKHGIAFHENAPFPALAAERRFLVSI